MIRMKKKVLRVGFDFDGVIAYFPLRIVRAPISFVKKKIFKVKKLTFFYPKSPLERFIWVLLHDTSTFPAKGINLFRAAVERGEIEAHLVTARYSFLDTHLDRWLNKHQLKGFFTSISINEKNEQPHLFKERMVNKMKFDYFVEDNMDIVEHLSKKTSTKVYWIYNIVDRTHPYPYKFPYLGKALESILAKESRKEA